MSNKVNGLWAVNSSSVFMFFDSVNTPSVWCGGTPERLSKRVCGGAGEGRSPTAIN